MARPCTICHHPERLAIEAALHSKRSLRPTAARWAVSKTSLLRHRQTHLPSAPDAADLPKAIAEAEAANLPQAGTAPETPPSAPVPQAAAAGSLRPSLPCTATECLDVLTTLRRYHEVRARIRVLEAMPEDDWAQRFPVPRAEVLETIRCWQERPLAARLKAWGVLR